MTTYHNGWNCEKIWAYVEKHNLEMKLVYNTGRGCMYKVGNGDIYKVSYSDYTPGMYPYTESIYLNDELVSVTRHE